MKFRMIAVALTLTLAACFPSVAQQDPGSQPAPSTPRKAADCACLAHHGHHANISQASTSCCHDKSGQAQGKSCCQDIDGKPMACCREHPKGDQSAMNCCQGADGRMCARDGQDCAAGKAGKSCCCKDAAVCNSKDGKNCCVNAAQHRSDCPSQS